MISHLHKFILITPPKTGSTSLMNTLLDYIQTHPKQIHTRRECKHLSYGIYSRQNGERMENYTLYGSIRNPYERMVSLWKFIKRKRNHPCSFDSFHDFIKLLKTHKRFSRNMLTFFSSIGGEVKVNKFIRVESFKEDFNVFCEDVGMETMELLHKNLTNNSNTTGEAYYRSFYDEESRKLVEEVFKRDLEYFGYSF